MHNRLSITLPSVLRLAVGCSLALLLFAGAASTVASADVRQEIGGGCFWSGQGPADGIGFEADGSGVMFVVIGISNFPINGVGGPCTYTFEGTNFIAVGRFYDVGVPARGCCTFDSTNALIRVDLSACSNPSLDSRDAALIMKTTDWLGHTSTTTIDVTQGGQPGPPDLRWLEAVRQSVNRKLAKERHFLMRTPSSCFGHRG